MQIAMKPAQSGLFFWAVYVGINEIVAQDAP